MVQQTDVFIFMGQSNMAGMGEAEYAPDCSIEAGLEYRAVSGKNALVKIEEPFGLN